MSCGRHRRRLNLSSTFNSRQHVPSANTASTSKIHSLVHSRKSQHPERLSNENTINSNRFRVFIVVNENTRCSLRIRSFHRSWTIKVTMWHHDWLQIMYESISNTVTKRNNQWSIQEINERWKIRSHQHLRRVWLVRHISPQQHHIWCVLERCFPLGISDLFFCFSTSISIVEKKQHLRSVLD